MFLTLILNSPSIGPILM